MKKKVNNLEKEVYAFDESFKATLEYFKGDSLAARAWVSKYALKNSAGNIFEKTPDDMHIRLASELARVESQYKNPMSKEKIYSLLKDFKYIIPQGGPMAGIGNNYQISSLSNCFVIGSEGKSDSYGGILRVDQEQVQLMKRRGGVGHDLSHIRPTGSPVKNSALTSTGIVPFMERYSNSTREVAQDGRRGALMLSVSIKHPDAENFIDAKLEQGKITGANISVRIDDAFMKAVAEDKKYIQQYPIDSINPKVKKEIDAKKLWKKIVHNAWKSAEPGILFWDTIINESVADSYADVGYKTVSTNPCGEIPLCPYDSCRLLAVNLYSYVDNPFTKEAKFKYNLFKEHINDAQRIMDDIIDLELEKIDRIIKKVDSDPEDVSTKSIERTLWENIRTKAEEGRRTGLGVTAEADMLAALGYKYGTKEAIDFATNIHKNLAIEAYRSSVNMAKERGAFTVYDSKKEKDNPLINRIKAADLELYQDMVKHGRRNISLLTIAPTGTTSLMTQTTSGIEPVFEPAYKRRRKVNPNDKNVHVSFVDESGDSWEEYNVFHSKFKKWMEVAGYDTSKLSELSKKEIVKLIEKSPYNRVASKDIDWLSKVKMQGSIQAWVDHSISVTTNLPRDATEDLVGDVYMAAWKAKCKGITVYREGSRSGVLISNNEKEAIKDFPKKRPNRLEAEVLRFNNGKDPWIAFVGKIEGRPYELFTGRADGDDLAVPRNIKEGRIVKTIEDDGRKHYDFKYDTTRGFEATIPAISYVFNKEFWNYGKMISGMLRNGVPAVKIINVIDGLKTKDEGINSWKAGVKRALKKYIPDGTKSGGTCPVCKSEYRYVEGCKTCDCGSKCE